MTGYNLVHTPKIKSCVRQLFSSAVNRRASNANVIWLDLYCIELLAINGEKTTFGEYKQSEMTTVD